MSCQGNDDRLGVDGASVLGSGGSGINTTVGDVGLHAKTAAKAAVTAMVGIYTDAEKYPDVAAAAKAPR